MQTGQIRKSFEPLLENSFKVTVKPIEKILKAVSERTSDEQTLCYKKGGGVLVPTNHQGRARGRFQENTILNTIIFMTE